MCRFFATPSRALSRALLPAGLFICLNLAHRNSFICLNLAHVAVPFLQSLVLGMTHRLPPVVQGPNRNQIGAMDTFVHPCEIKLVVVAYLTVTDHESKSRAVTAE